MTEKTKPSPIRLIARCACDADLFQLALNADASEMQIICPRCSRTVAAIPGFAIHWGEEEEETEDEKEAHEDPH